jgi:hypothetical protein
MKPLFLILTSLCFFSLTFGQSIQIGITGNIGISQMTTNDYWQESTSNAPLPSSALGFYFTKKISNQWSLGLESLLVQIESRGSMEGPSGEVIFSLISPQTGGIIYYQKLIVVNYLSYIALPIFIKYKTKRFSIQGGLQTMLLGFSRYNEVKEEYHPTMTGYETEPYRRLSSKGKLNHANKIDFGTKIGIGFYLNPHIWLRSDIYYGLKDTLAEKRSYEPKRKNRQITVGIIYYLPSKN